MQRKVAAALVAALALGLAGCGGGQETETVSRAEAISRLEAACLAGTRAARREAQQGSGMTMFLAATAANLKAIEEKIGDLEASGSAKASFDAYKDTVRTRIERLERIVSADRADQPALMRAARSEIAAASLRARDAIFALGARHVCI
jgi:hypothetical protein